MKYIKHNFDWEQDASHKTFWKYQTNIKEQCFDEASKIIKLCNINKGKILDVGCGLGYHVQAFLNFGLSAVGIDIADYCIEQAKGNTGIKEIYKIKGADISWEEEFNLVIALRHTLGYMMLNDLKIHLTKLWRSVKQGGYFLLTVPFTLERGKQGLPVHKWSEENGKFTLVEKKLTSGNIKTEKCIIIDTHNDTIEEYNEVQRYYSWKEILDLFNACGIDNIISLKNFEGEKAATGVEARIFLAQKL